MKRIHRLLAVALCAIVLLIGGRQSQMVSAGQDDTQPALYHDVIWTKWGADHYALADDGDSIWIGTASGLIRWSKSDNSYARYSTADGLPHRDVLAIAVDGQGNRWFGGDGWLSRLDPAEKSTTYDLANIGLPSSPVNGIAAGTDGTVWLSHVATPNISQLNLDGTWVVYSDSKTAVTANHAKIKLTVNKNSLWTVSGDDVWIGYDRYDGGSWQRFTPPQGHGSPLIVDADSKGNVWFLSNSSYVYAWNGQDWLEYTFFGYWSGSASTLVVGENDEVWIGWEERCGHPYAPQCSGISLVPETPGAIYPEEYLGGPPPVAGLWATQEGLWGTGPGWLLLPGGETVRFSDVPLYEHVGSVVVDRQGRTWILSIYADWYMEGAMQTLDDKGTPTINDDEGKVWSFAQTLHAIEPAPNGDLWIAGKYEGRHAYPHGPTRFHGDTVIDYTPPSRDAFIYDIFVQDDRRVWFVYDGGIWSFDDGGTPLMTSDDAWNALESPPYGASTVAVQGDRIWIGNSHGLYLYNGAGWEQVRTERVIALLPASDGSLFVGLGATVLIIEPDGHQSLHLVVDAISNELARVRRTQRRNLMWTVAPDGGVWYWMDAGLLARRDDAGLQVYQTPIVSDYIEVDEHNHVWMTADGSLWRMSERPDFDLEVQPSFWLMSTDDVQTGTIAIHTVAGYAEMVTPTVNGLPAGVSATVIPNPVSPGESATLRLASVAAPPGEYELTINAYSNFLTHERVFRLAVMEQVYDLVLPVVAR